jgi:D-3-phosphoglycerate dehydrogenase
VSKFRVALSGDFVKADGTPAYPMFDLRPLSGDDIEYFHLPPGPEINGSDLEEADALIQLGVQFTRQSVPKSGRLSVVARFGVGYDNVDVDACTENGVAAVITPDGVRRPVAASILTLILALTGKLFVKDRITRLGPDGWAQKSDHMGVGIVGKTLGSVGIGNIGAEMFRLAKPLDMSFMAFDPYADQSAAAELGVRVVGDIEAVFREADIVSINCPLTEETKGLIGERLLSLMKPTAYLINTARGPIVDQAALTKALQDGRIAGAGLDVFENEPSDTDDPLFALDNVIVTPHALCWTDQCFAGIGAADVKAVTDVMYGREPAGVVNRVVLDAPRFRERLSAYAKQFGGG